MRDIQAGAADDSVAQHVDQIVGDDVAATGDVDDPGVVLHQGELIGTEHALGLGGEGQCQHHEVGVGQGIGEPVRFEHVVDTGHRLDVAANDRDLAVPWLQESNQRRRDPTASENGDVAAEQVAAGRPGPLRRSRIPAEVAQTRHPECERHLGDGFRVDALAAGPDAIVIEVVDEVLDPGERQLHPADSFVLVVVEDRRQRVDVSGVGPHDRLGGVRTDEFGTTGDHRGGQPVGRSRRAEVDAGRVAVRHLTRTVVGRIASIADRA